jgi:hypothetical protein
MIYVKQEITDFISTNLTDVYSEWSALTTYIVETDMTLTNASMVRFGTYYYRSLISENLNFQPDLYPSKWIKWEVSNKFAMLDLSSQSKSTFNGDMTVSFATTRYTDTITIGYYSASSVLVELFDANDTLVWTYVLPTTIYEDIYDWYSWTYPSYEEELNRAIMIKIQSGISTKCKVTMTRWAEALQAECGFLIAGTAVDMGKTLSNINFKYTSYATKSIDSFGSLLITKRAVQDIVDFQTIIDRGSFSNNTRKIKDIYNEIVMFAVDERDDSEFENLITLGVIQDAFPVLTEFDKVVVSYSIMEAI